MPVKTITEKSITKPRIGVPQKQPRSSQLPLTPTPTPTPTPTTTNFATNTRAESLKQNSPGKPKPTLKKKSVCFQKPNIQNPDNNVQKESVIGPKTPVASVSPSLNKGRVSGTPYHTENCSKCRFDRLETSSYWLAQIKLAESVGKHFISAAFFRLAFDSKAEPIRNIRIELKHYLSRHGYLSAQTEWRDCSFAYGLLKEEKRAF